MSFIRNFDGPSRNLEETINIVKSLGKEGIDDRKQLLKASKKIAELLTDSNFASYNTQLQLLERHDEITAMIINSRSLNSLDLDNAPAQQLAEKLTTFKKTLEAGHKILNSPSSKYSNNANSISSNAPSPTKNSPSSSTSRVALNRSSLNSSIFLGWDDMENKFQSIKDSVNFIEDSQKASEIVAEKQVGSYLLSLPSDAKQPIYTFSIFIRTEEGVKEVAVNHNGEGYHLLGQKEGYSTIDQLVGAIPECTHPVFFEKGTFNS